jgi:hypothetical protein
MRLGWRFNTSLNFQQELLYSVFGKIHFRLFTVSEDNGIVFNVLASWPLCVFLYILIAVWITMFQHYCTVLLFVQSGDTLQKMPFEF